MDRDHITFERMCRWQFEHPSTESLCQKSKPLKICRVWKQPRCPSLGSSKRREAWRTSRCWLSKREAVPLVWLSAPKTLSPTSEDAAHLRVLKSGIRGREWLSPRAQVG